MRSARMILAAVLAAGVVWAVGAPGAQRPPAAPAAPTEKAVAKSAPVRSAGKPASADAQTEQEIRERFAKSKIGPEKFQVHVQGGVATIEGKTDVVQHKGVATRLAKNGGAVAVVNHIEISDAAREKAAKNLDEGRRRAQVKRGEARSER